LIGANRVDLLPEDGSRVQSQNIALNKNWASNNVQNVNNRINIPSSQTFRFYDTEYLKKYLLWQSAANSLCIQA
jgi:hypothetical protein